MKKLILLGAGAVGYVLGAKAGRERYEQIAESARKLRNNPTVQEKVGEAQHAAKHAATDAAGAASQKVREARESSGDSSTDTPTTGVPANGFGRGDEGTS